MVIEERDITYTVNHTKPHPMAVNYGYHLYLYQFGDNNDKYSIVADGDPDSSIILMAYEGISEARARTLFQLIAQAIEKRD